MRIPSLLALLRPPKAAQTPTVDVAKLQEELRLAKAAHLGAARRISAFGLAHPELYKLYFTKAGDKLRKEQRNEVT